MYQWKEVKAASKRKSGFYRKGESIPECIKKKAREKPYVLECERIRKQQIRQEKKHSMINQKEMFLEKDLSMIQIPCQKVNRKTLKIFKSLLNNFILI